MKFLCLFFVSLAAMAEPPSTNLDFDVMAKAAETNKSPQKKLRQMAAGFEVAYGTTDLTRGDHVAKAIQMAQKAAEKKSLWTSFPKLDKAYKKNPELARDDEYIQSIIALNLKLREALNTSDPKQKRANLHPVYVAAPTYIPTMVAVVETEWELENFKAGDNILQQALQMEPKEASWPLLVLNAKRERRLQGIDAGLKSLEAAEKFSWLKANPATQLRQTWTQEIQQAQDAEALYQLGAMEKLAEKAQSGDPKDAYYAALWSIEHGVNLSKASKWLKAAQKSQPDNVDYFLLESKTSRDGSSGYPKKLAKRAAELAAKYPENADLVWWQSQVSGLESEEKLELYQRAFQLDPQNSNAWRSLVMMHMGRDEKPAIKALHEKRIEDHASSENEAAYLSWLVDTHQSVEALESLKTLLDQYPDNLSLYSRGKKLLLFFPKEAAFKGYFAAQLIKRIEERANAFDFTTAAELAGFLVDMYPDRPEVNLLAGNLLVYGNQTVSSLAYYEKALEHFPNKPYLQELVGDGHLADDKNRKAVDAYQEALRLDPARKENVEPKMEQAKKRIKQKVGQGFAIALAAGAIMSGATMNINPPRFNNIHRIQLAKKTAKGSWWGGSREEDGYGVPETRELLLDFYNDVLDFEADWETRQEAM